MEKPTAAPGRRIPDADALVDGTGKFVITGLKKIFTPAMEKVKEIITSPEFGTADVDLGPLPAGPAGAGRPRRSAAMIGFLDHIYHPAAVLLHLMGPVARFDLRMGAADRRQRGNACGSPPARSAPCTWPPARRRRSPLERVEVIGEGANVVVENGVRLTYYRRGAAPPYGRSASYVCDDEVAPLRWEPEFSLGQLYNKNLFYLGYVPEILHFCERCWPASRRGTRHAPGDHASFRIHGCRPAKGRMEDGDHDRSSTPPARPDVIEEEQEWGRLVWMVSGALGNSDTMTVGRCHIGPGEQNPRHHHPNCDEVLHVLRGTIEHSLDDGPFRWPPGDTVSIPSGTLHNARNVADEQAIFVISFSTPDRQTVGE